MGNILFASGPPFLFSSSLPPVLFFSSPLHFLPTLLNLPHITEIEYKLLRPILATLFLPHYLPQPPEDEKGACPAPTTCHPTLLSTSEQGLTSQDLRGWLSRGGGGGGSKAPAIFGYPKYLNVCQKRLTAKTTKLFF